MTWGRQPPESLATVLARIRERCPTGWFGPRDVLATKPELLELAKAGELETVKDTRSNRVYFKVRNA